MPNPIPTRSRQLVHRRDLGRCFRCGSPARSGAWHHRRGKAVPGQHQHCPCNGIWLCNTCHTWVHGHPFEARAKGWIVTRHQEFPGAEPAQSHFGVLLLDCDGGFTYDTYD